MKSERHSKRKAITPLSLALAVISCVSSFNAAATILWTQPGKIISTQGHFLPAGRVVVFKESGTGNQLAFRIPSTTGPDNGIAATVLAALVANRDIQIYYDPAQTTGCGTEPQISYVTIY